MLDPVIKKFLEERKDARIKAKTKASMSDEEKLDVAREAEGIFSPENWIADAARRAGQLNLVSHPAKFTHPGAKASSVIAACRADNDGFLRTGNVCSGLDVFGNAAALDVYKFLTLQIPETGSEAKSILEHLEQKTDYIEKQFDFAAISFSELKDGFLAIKQDSAEGAITSEKIKQVYFPVDDNYHLLSVLTPSGLMYGMKEALQPFRYPDDETKEIRKLKRGNKFSEKPLAEMYNFNVIGFGGTKPQNISILNSQNYGEAYLLESLPFPLQRQDIWPPKTSFFTSPLNAWRYKGYFHAFHKKIGDLDKRNIVDGRIIRDDIVQAIISAVIEESWKVRQLAGGWSEDEAFNKLALHQKIWLDAVRSDQREEDKDWLIDVRNDISRWFFASYEKVVGKDSVKTGDPELIHVRDIVKAIIRQNEGGLL